MGPPPPPPPPPAGGGGGGGPAAPKRSAARSTPTRAQRGTRPKKFYLIDSSIQTKSLPKNREAHNNL
ncbi:MAG: hypothetical protein RML94_11485 [Bacteroidia bacterium]|nr:hypothetical protein [Bacteroidia bacterium]